MTSTSVSATAQAPLWAVVLAGAIGVVAGNLLSFLSAVFDRRHDRARMLRTAKQQTYDEYIQFLASLTHKWMDARLRHQFGEADALLYRLRELGALVILRSPRLSPWVTPVAGIFMEAESPPQPDPAVLAAVVANPKPVRANLEATLQRRFVRLAEVMNRDVKHPRRRLPVAMRRPPDSADPS